MITYLKYLLYTALFIVAVILGAIITIAPWTP